MELFLVSCLSVQKCPLKRNFHPIWGSSRTQRKLQDNRTLLKTKSSLNDETRLSNWLEISELEKKVAFEVLEKVPTHFICNLPLHPRSDRDERSTTANLSLLVSAYFAFGLHTNSSRDLSSRWTVPHTLTTNNFKRESFKDLSGPRASLARCFISIDYITITMDVSALGGISINADPSFFSAYVCQCSWRGHIFPAFLMSNAKAPNLHCHNNINITNHMDVVSKLDQAWVNSWSKFFTSSQGSAKKKRGVTGSSQAWP